MGSVAYREMMFRGIGNQEREEHRRQMKSISHALEVLLLFSDARKSLSVTEVARQTGLHKSTVSRILSTLAKARFVARDADTGRYTLGFGILSLAGAVLARYQLPSAARQERERLADTTGETVTVSGWNGIEAVNVDQILGRGGVKNFAPPGRTNPAHCTATGKTYLAYANETTVRAILSRPLQRLTDQTITNRAVLLRQLAQVRERGYAVGDREFLEDVCALAAPVFNAQGNVAYVIAITIPSFRFAKRDPHEWAQALLMTTRELSARLGYSSRSWRPSANSPPTRHSSNASSRSMRRWRTRSRSTRKN